MGTCTSVHKDRKVEGAEREGKVADSGLARSDFGSEGEIFFDSRPWVDSDCEDDFYSVRGDFTPSRGSTPIHPSSFRLTPKLNKTYIDVFPDTPSEPSPRKKLAELLLETSADEKKSNGQVENGKTEEEKVPGSPTTTTPTALKTTNGTLNFSEVNGVSSHEATPKSGLSNGRVKSFKSMQCCLPSVHGFSVYEWKKQRASPMHQNAVVA